MEENHNRLQIINNFYISLEEQRVSRKRTIPQQVNFEFDPENLDAIAQMQDNNNSLSFDDELLTNLRYYSLCQCHNIMRSGLDFTSYYCQGEQKIAVISSNISIQGQISQQIRHDFLSNLSLLEKIIEAHYWSIDQVFQQLPLTFPKKSYWLFWIVPLLITFAIAILIFHFLLNIFGFNAIVSVLVFAIAILIIFILTKFGLRNLVKRFLFKLILSQLLFGLFSYNYNRRKLGFKLLDYFK
ncbi:MAG: hypothetical protein AAGA80_25530 [Cyanobacteria bacterium P01_F01_bin.143]